MAWLLAPLYDSIMAGVERSCLGRWRGELLKQARGAVLEIGAGTGVNLQHYPEGLERMVLLEPDPGMRRQLVSKSSHLSQVEFCEEPSEALPFASDSFDTVVSTLVLCTTPDPAASLAEIKRVLKPGGQLLFLEHVLAGDNPRYAAWQRRLEPLWKRCAGGCHLTRDTERSIKDAGFELTEVTRERMRKSLPLIAPTVRGSAKVAI